MNEAVKTTVIFSPLFHAKLKAVAQGSGTPMGELIEQHLTPIIADMTVKQHRAVFDGLYALEGTIKDPIPDASTTIDEIVYGDGETNGTHE